VSAQPEPPIGQRIREERLRRGFNLRSLARAVNVSASHISQIETGKCRPSVSTLYAITTVLGVSIDDIFDGPSDGVGLTVGGAPAGSGVTGGAPEIVDGDGVLVAVEPQARVAVRELSDGDGALGDDGAPGEEGAPRVIVAPGQLAAQGAAAALVALASEHARRVGPVIGPGERETLELDSGVTWERLGHVPGLHVDFLLITYAPGGSSSSTEKLMRHTGTEYGYLISGELIVTLGFREYRIVPGDAICFASSTPHRYRNEGSEEAVGVWFVANPDAP
jgi:transcriptional regulator with XRE-family HTH domain/quercetin dioxygenase-like cupin family protein